MNEVQEQLQIIYKAQMQMAIDWAKDGSTIWDLKESLVRNLESELEMVE